MPLAAAVPAALDRSLFDSPRQRDHRRCRSRCTISLRSAVLRVRPRHGRLWWTGDARRSARRRSSAAACSSPRSMPTSAPCAARAVPRRASRAVAQALSRRAAAAAAPRRRRRARSVEPRGAAAARRRLAAAEATLVEACDELLLQAWAAELGRVTRRLPPARHEQSPRLLRMGPGRVHAGTGTAWHNVLLEALVEAARAGAATRPNCAVPQGMCWRPGTRSARAERSAALLAELRAARCRCWPRCWRPTHAACCTSTPASLIAARGLRGRDAALAAQGFCCSARWDGKSPPDHLGWHSGVGAGRALLTRRCAAAAAASCRCARRCIALQAVTALWPSGDEVARERAAEAQADARWLARAPEIEVALHQARVRRRAARRGRRGVAAPDLLFHHEDRPGRLRFWRGHAAGIAARASTCSAAMATLAQWQAQHLPAARAGPDRSPRGCPPRKGAGPRRLRPRGAAPHVPCSS